MKTSRPSLTRLARTRDSGLLDGRLWMSEVLSSYSTMSEPLMNSLKMLLASWWPLTKSPTDAFPRSSLRLVKRSQQLMLRAPLMWLRLYAMKGRQSNNNSFTLVSPQALFRRFAKSMGMMVLTSGLQFCFCEHSLQRVGKLGEPTILPGEEGECGWADLEAGKQQFRLIISASNTPIGNSKLVDIGPFFTVQEESSDHRYTCPKYIMRHLKPNPQIAFCWEHANFCFHTLSQNRSWRTVKKICQSNFTCFSFCCFDVLLRVFKVKRCLSVSHHWWLCLFLYCNVITTRGTTCVMLLFLAGEEISRNYPKIKLDTRKFPVNFTTCRDYHYASSKVKAVVFNNVLWCKLFLGWAASTINLRFYCLCWRFFLGCFFDNEM